MINYEEIEEGKNKENYVLLIVNSDDHIQYLEDMGYVNVQELKYDDLKVKCVVVHDDKKVFHTLQLRYAVDIQKDKVLNFEEFKVINDVNNTIGD